MRVCDSEATIDVHERRIEFYRHHESFSTKKKQKNLPLIIRGEKGKETDARIVTANSTFPQGASNSFLLLIPTGEDDPHPPVTRRSRHLHADNSLLSSTSTVPQPQDGVITCTPGAWRVGVD